MDQARHKRQIKSFVLRQGRVTQRQKDALQRHWTDYGLVAGSMGLDYAKTFHNIHSTYLEIGFGMGDSLVEMARLNPDRNYIGVEVHTPGVGALIDKCMQANCQNVKVFSDDINAVLSGLTDASLAGVYILFPDPWPKKRHHKRRLIQPAFISKLLVKVRPGGFLYCATDWHDYADQMLKVLSSDRGLKNSTVGFLPHAERPRTKFEQRGLRLGHQIWDLKFMKC